ncbi:MAG: N-6 DNA methylase, partial [Spirochaetales bacterium]|nr:N-6 DNA methylase [Spirochaetales bacterium]
MDHDGSGPERENLRGPPGEERRGYKKRCRLVFYPRALIKAMVECVRPGVEKTICAPACGTGGFFLVSYDFIVHHNKLNKKQKKFLKN